jgi:hypothetical protein
MPTESKERVRIKERKRRWVRPLITMIILLGLLLLITNGKLLKPFGYSNF